MSDRIRERHAEGLDRLQARVAELDTEIRAMAAERFADSLSAHKSLDGYRHGLGQLILERLCLAELMAAHDDALQLALDEEVKRLEYVERVEKPKQAEEAKRLELKRRDEEHNAAVIGAMWRVKSTINRHARPDDSDVALLRRSMWFDDLRHGSVKQLVYRIDHGPRWWTEDQKAS